MTGILTTTKKLDYVELFFGFWKTSFEANKNIIQEKRIALFDFMF
jgi:hypothetical protein